mmetsp:Transcript_50919/g.74582  ORF Transcript_50919/g.74582 Transcript_50919/m.74582 type:complete len:82 (+) Transcript_50919:694-939(+)
MRGPRESTTTVIDFNGDVSVTNVNSWERKRDERKKRQSGVAEGGGGAYGIPEKYEILQLCGLKDMKFLNYVSLNVTSTTSK